MHHSTLTTALLLSLSFLTTATPIPFLSARDTSVTEAQIKKIAPSSASCSDAPAEGECATAKTAASSISESFETYKVSSKGEQAAIISLMAFESDEFKYNKNHFPGTPGQGTRNMQSPAFNKKYAASLPSLSSKIAAVSNDPAGLLDLLRDNEKFDFGSGAWFLTTQCSKSVRSALQTGSESGWNQYISDCVGTSVTEERKEYWQKAIDALGA